MAPIRSLPKHIQLRFRAKFFPLQHRAWQVHARDAAIAQGDHGAETAWRKAQQISVVGVDSFNDLDHLADFEAMMLHWAMIAQDDREIGYWSGAVERRYRHLIGDRMAELAWVGKCVYDWGTVRRILDHMHLCDRIEDCPAEHLKTVLLALDTHLRRACQERKISPACLRAEMSRAA